MDGTGAGGNPLVDLANTVGGNAITGAESLLAGPIGFIIALVIGLSLLGLAVFAIKKFTS